MCAPISPRARSGSNRDVRAFCVRARDQLDDLLQREPRAVAAAAVLAGTEPPAAVADDGPGVPAGAHIGRDRTRRMRLPVAVNGRRREQPQFSAASVRRQQRREEPPSSVVTERRRIDGALIEQRADVRPSIGKMLAAIEIDRAVRCGLGHQEDLAGLADQTRIREVVRLLEHGLHVADVRAVDGCARESPEPARAIVALDEQPLGAALGEQKRIGVEAAPRRLEDREAARALRLRRMQERVRPAPQRDVPVHGLRRSRQAAHALAQNLRSEPGDEARRRPRWSPGWGQILR